MREELIISKLKEILKEYKEKLDKVQAKSVDENLGSLGYSVSKKYVSYYHYKVIDGQKTRAYIKKKDLSFAKKLAQNTYNINLIKKLNRKIRVIEKFINNFETDNIDSLFDDLTKERKNLVTPIEPTYAEKRQDWVDQRYQTNSIDYSGQTIHTKRGERVRSKSEKIIADLLYGLGLDYKYEKALNLNSYNTIYPDFTILSPITLEEVYIEHFGLMDNHEYCLKAINKIHTYEAFGYYLGDQLITTFETREEGADFAALEKYLITRFNL